MEQILNTKMITANRAEELVKQQATSPVEDENYIGVTSIFDRVVQPSPLHSNLDKVEEEKEEEEDSPNEEEVRRRCMTLSSIDRISSKPVVTPIPVISSPNNSTSV